MKESIEVKLAAIDAQIAFKLRLATEADAKGRARNIQSWIGAAERLVLQAEELDAEAAALRRQLRIAAACRAGYERTRGK